MAEPCARLAGAEDGGMQPWMGATLALGAVVTKPFNEMSTSGVCYHQIVTYDDLLQIMGSID